ncbi:SigE family RNA polymerase sigma factor [Streptomyces sp. NR30]|uniref:RNA polymerase sigma factor n=2 Tax=Streptomyces guryensis TaxID=2886947 RepID=A0A9Q3VM36_9ACTN|nr:SigE family RNA polymerase sigma factor [Streptomyces guryensis]MCD9873370.1 SigE family RNA polymerase sigma factor [Streptomyces guryensis]
MPEFEEYVRARHDALLRSARRLVHDPLDAQDLLQTALVRTYRRWDRIADKRLADAYLRRVMINTRTEWWRARKIQELPSAQLPDTSVEDCTEQHADRALLMEVIRTLPHQQRAVVVLRHWEQMSTQETAAALGMAPGTVKSTLHRALTQLRHELQSRDRNTASASATGRRTEPMGPPASSRDSHSAPRMSDSTAAEGRRTAHRPLGVPRPVRAPTGSRSGVPRGHQSSWPGSDS